MAVPDTNQTFTFNANMSPTLQTQPSYLGIGNNPATTQQFFNMGQNQSGGGNWMQQAGSWLNSDSMSQGMGLGSMSNMNMILQADQMGGQLMGLLAGQNESTVGNIVKSIPGLSTVGNLINAAFGSSINEEFVNQTKSQTNALGSQVFNSNTNADVLNDWQNMTAMSHVRKSEVGSDGWFSSDAEDTTDDLNRKIDKANKRQLFNFDLAVNNADRNTDFRILSNMTAYGGPINSFRKYYSFGGSLYDTPQFFSVEPQTYDKGGYLSQAKALIRQNEGWREKPYADAPKGKNWRSVGYGFNDSGFRDKYPEGISKHYEHGITRKQAEEELDYFLNRAEKTLKGIYGKQWNDFTDSQKAAILDTYYQRPASVGKSSRFYKAVTAGEDAGKYLGVAGYNKRNKVRQGVFGGSQDYVNLGIETGNTESNPSTLQEVTPFTPVVHDLDLSGITPTEAKALELNLTSPTFDLSMFGKPMTTPTQQAVPTVGTVEDFLASYGDFEENLFEKGGNLYSGGGYTKTYIDSRGREVTFHRFPRETDEQYEARYAERVAMRERNAAANKARYERRKAANEAGAARLNRAINTVTNVMEEQAKATPFTGQEIQQAAEEQRQEKLDKWRDYKKGINATITAAELGLSGASLLGAYANWRNWATAANATKRGIANLLQKAQLPMQIGGTLIDGYQTYDALQNNDNYNANYNGISTGLGVAGSVGASDIFLNSRFHSPKVDRVLDAMGVIQNSGDFIKFGYDSMFGNKKAEGGPIHIAPSKKGTFTAAASKYGLGGNLFEDGGKLNIKDKNKFDNGGWMDFFNMWNQAQGGNNYFGNNNWKPSDGLQRTTSNGNAGDWMGVAGTTINTLANWGKEDPSLGRGGGYSMFGMAAYDIMKAIRNATKSKRESIGQKLAIPIYAQGGHLFDDGGSVGALGYANIANSALKLASNVKHQTELDIDPDKVYRSADRYGMGLDEAVANVNTNGDLLDLWANNSTVSANLSGRDFRDKSYFDDFLDSYAASWEGFNAGQNFGPWGAAIGAVIGGGSSVIGSIIGRNKADNAAETANRRLENANERRAHNLIAAAERVDEENDLRILQNMGANGGKLNMGFGLRNPFIMPDGTANPLFRAFGGGLTHGSDWDTGINWVNEGGSHGENPLGGVQMGVDEQGVPNLVEEGEAIWNGDYVFSKRMKVPKKLAKKYGLGGDMTFADAIAKLTKDSEERPLSNIDRATNDHILGEFADTQEELRMAKAQRAMDKEVQLQDDFLTGFQFGLGGHMSPIGIIPDADNISPFEKAEKLFADGGGIHIDPSKKGTFKAQASKMGMGVQEAASHILAHKKDYSPEMVKKAVFAHNFAHAFGGSLFEDGGDLFSNPFAYGGELGNVFAGEGNRPNTLNLDAANQSLVRRIFGDTGFTRFMENTSAALNDPLSYFAGDEINAVIDKLGKMSEPQLEKFFRTDIGKAIAPYLAGDGNSQAQEAGMRGAKSVANIVRRVQRPVQIAAKKAMAQSRQAARGQMRTPKGGGSQKVLNETMTPTQAARQATTGSTEGLPQGWNFTRGNTSTVTNTSGVTGRLNPKSPTGRAAQSRGTAPDPFAGLESTLNLRAPIGSGNFGYLPWALGAAGVGGAGYGLYKGIDWLADNLTNPDGTITGVNDPATQAAINSLPSEATSNRGNGNKGKAAVTETSAITPEETGAASTRRGSQGTSRERGNGSGTATRNRGSVVPFAYDWYRNGSDGIGTPTGFKVGKNGKAYDYTPEYKALVASLGADDIRKWAAEHPNDPSLKSFLAKGNDLSKLTDEQWRIGATDGKYGFMHHVADQISKEKDRVPADFNWEQEAPWLFGNIAAPETAKPNPMAEIARDKSTPTRSVSVTDNGTNFGVVDTPQAITRSGITDTTSGAVDGITRSPFKPKQTWTRYAPMVMSGLMGLKEMLTPADYANADAIMAAAYQAGAPVSVGTEYIGDYRKRDPFDETYLMNIINQNSRAANRNFMNISGGNRAVAMSGILANDLTTQMALAEAARQAYLANRADDAQVAEFNRGTNQFNATAQNTRNLSLAQLNSGRQHAMLSGIAQGARLRQAIKDQRDAAISANLTNFAQGLGDLGKENGYYNMLGGLNEEGILKYFYGDDWKTKFNNVNV